MRRLLPLFGGILLGLGVGIVIFFGFLQEVAPAQDSGFTAEPLPGPALDVPAPDFELPRVTGESRQLEDYRGKPLLLNFWATWCAPCRLEMPVFQRSYEQYADQFALVAINNAEDPVVVQPFVDELGLTFDILLDPDAAVQHRYQIRGYPTTFLIDADGVIRAQHIGLMSADQLHNYLQELGVK